MELTNEELKEEKSSDPDLTIVREWQEQGLRSQWQVIYKFGQTVKGYWWQWDSLCLKDELITRKWESPDGSVIVYQKVIPHTRIKRVLQELHYGRSWGQFGVNRTLARVRDRYYWIDCCKDVEEWRKRCDLCPSKKGPKTRSRRKMMQYISGTPWERVAVDIAGPFAPTDSGNEYLTMALDYFSKWPEVVPIPNQEATTVAESLLENVKWRHGVPLEIHTDQGRNFESDVWKHLMTILGIKNTRMVPLHPQSDGMVERHNRTINQYLLMFINENERNWDKLVPLFLLAYISSEHESTGYTPSMLLTGREMKLLPIDLMVCRLPANEFEEGRNTLPEYITDQEERVRVVTRNHHIMSTRRRCLVISVPKEKKI